MTGLQQIAAKQEGLLQRLALGSGYTGRPVHTPLCRAAIAIIDSNEFEWPHRERMDEYWRITKLPRAEQLAIAGALMAEEIDREQRAQAPDPPPAPAPTHTSNHVPRPGKMVQVKEDLLPILRKEAYLPEVAAHLAQLSGVIGRIDAISDDGTKASVFLDKRGTVEQLPVSALTILD